MFRRCFPAPSRRRGSRGTYVWGIRPPDRPRASTGIQRWTEWCGHETGGTSWGCEEMLLLEMTWALDYLGASEDCVLPVYHARVRAILDAGQYWDFRRSRRPVRVAQVSPQSWTPANRR